MSKFIGDVSAYAYAVSKGYTGTEEEFAELMASYADVGQTAVDAKDAAVAAKTAAQTAATTATDKATEATTAAQTATTKAGEASQSASQASASATTASTKASEASQSASTASTKATEATTAAGTATTAKNDAVAAKTAAETAQTAAETAQEAAEDAAESVSASAEQIAQNTSDITDKAPVILETASGSIASFTDGSDMPMKSLVAKIEPIQDLHGYDSPWPAGGGKNKIDASNVSVPANSDNYAVLVQSIILPAGTYTMSWTLDKNVSATRNRPYYIPSGASSGIVYGEQDSKTAGRHSWTFTLEEEKNLEFRWWYHTVSEACTISDFQLELGSTATSYTPYSNICPISGWTGVTVSRTGKNLLVNASDSYTIANAQYHDYTVADASALLGQTLTFSIDGTIASGKKINVYAKGTNNDVIKNGEINAKSVSFQFPSTLPDGFQSLRIYIADFTGTESVIGSAQLEFGSTATSYEPYNGNTYSVDWQTEAGTVYGGTIDVVSGELVVDRQILDLGTLAWSATDGRGRRYSGNVLDMDTSGAWATNPTLTAENYKSYGNNVLYSDTSLIGIAQNGQNIYVRTNEDTPSGMVVYPLATPITYQLTPTEVQSILGQNHVWADTGDVDAEYRADTKLYIQRLTQPDTADLIADANITSGQYFMVGNDLYKATANIANGASISPNVNCTRKSLSEALNEINA